MSNRRERRREQALDLLSAWSGIGVWARLLFTLAIIAGMGWLVFQCIGLIVFTLSLLRGF